MPMRSRLYASVFVGGLASLSAAACSPSSSAQCETNFLIEHNPIDQETGFQILLDGERWDLVRVRGPVDEARPMYCTKAAPAPAPAPAPAASMRNTTLPTDGSQIDVATELVQAEATYDIEVFTSKQSGAQGISVVEFETL